MHEKGRDALGYEYRVVPLQHQAGAVHTKLPMMA